MKKSFVFTLLLALGCTLNLYALDDSNGDIIAKTKTYKDKTITVHLANLQKKLTQIKLTDIDGETEYYKETIKDHNGFAKSFNLKKLKNGNYLIKVTQGEKTIQQVLRIRGDEVMYSRFS